MKDITFKNLTDEQINAIKVLLDDACEIEEEKDTSFPKNGDEFYFILSDGEIDSKYYSPTSSIDMDCISMGNCFKTEEEAEFEVERLKVIHEIKKFTEPEDYAWDNKNCHYTFVYNTSSKNCLEIQGYYTFKTGSIYFKSSSDINACIEAVGEDRIKKYYFGIKELQIIKPGTKKVTKCKNCGCQFSYEEEDVKVDVKNNIPSEKWVICPQCEKSVIVEAARIPKDASKSVQRRIGFMTEDLF